MKLIKPEELLSEEQYYSVTSGDEYEIHAAMKEYAKLHVEAVLSEVIKNLPYDDRMNQDSRFVYDIKQKYLKSI